jgi:hypothetical protein
MQDDADGPDFLEFFGKVVEMSEEKATFLGHVLWISEKLWKEVGSVGLKARDLFDMRNDLRVLKLRSKQSITLRIGMSRVRMNAIARPTRFSGPAPDDVEAQAKPV